MTDLRERGEAPATGLGERTVRALVIDGPGRMRIAEDGDEAVADGCFRVDTVASGVSIGTEMTWFRGTNPALRAHWDAELGLFRRGGPTVGWPVRRFGYMQVGRVVASRFEPLTEDTLVAMAYGHRTGHTAVGLAERAVPLPDGLDPRLGVLVAHMGPICANGLLHAAHDLVGTAARDLGDGVRGREVVVVGGGLVGLLTGLFARAHGAAEVLVVDQSERRLAAASRLELQPVPQPAGDAEEASLAVAELVKQRYRHGPADRGASVVFQCRGRVAALATALRCARPQGEVVDLAFYDGGAEGLYLGQEFHHNGLALRCAQIGRVPRGLGASWDRERLSRETIELLLEHGDLVGRHLLTDDLPFERAPYLFAEIDARRTTPIGVVLRP
jgi:threonine dehydrogenase-like Zn-dependent dehydrogenase